MRLRPRFSFGADEGVALGLIVEGTPVEQAVWVDAVLGRYMGHDADLFAAAGVCAIRVASVCDDVQCQWLAQRLTRGLGHRQQATVIGCVEGCSRYVFAVERLSTFPDGTDKANHRFGVCRKTACVAVLLVERSRNGLNEDGIAL
jgi:hypothetical protein